MPHLSKKQLKREHLEKLYKELGDVLSMSTKRSLTVLFLQEFFTKTEKIMFAKRFAIICMLDKGVPQSYIYESLGMSPATIARMSLQYELGKYKTILSLIKREKEDIWKFLEKILSAGLPPKVGRGRWKFLYQGKSNLA